MLQMGHLRNALIRHQNSARGSHRFAFGFKLQNADLGPTANVVSQLSVNDHISPRETRT